MEMKQGRASRDVHESYHVDPKAMAISPAGVSQIGIAVDPKAVENVHKGRGFMAPPVDETCHPCGSQGKHK